MQTTEQTLTRDEEPDTATRREGVPPGLTTVSRQAGFGQVATALVMGDFQLHGDPGTSDSCRPCELLNPRRILYPPLWLQSSPRKRIY